MGGALRGLGRFLVLPVLAAGVFGVASAAHAADDGCAVGEERDAKRCMHQIAPPGACAAPRSGDEGGAGSAGGGGCADGLVGSASNRFSPGNVAAGEGPAQDIAFQPPAPGPAPGPDLQPGDIGGGPTIVPPPPPPPAPPITLIESPAVPKPPPGL